MSNIFLYGTFPLKKKEFIGPVDSDIFIDFSFLDRERRIWRRGRVGRKRMKSLNKKPGNRRRHENHARKLCESRARLIVCAIGRYLISICSAIFPSGGLWLLYGTSWKQANKWPPPLNTYWISVPYFTEGFLPAEENGDQTNDLPREREFVRAAAIRLHRSGRLSSVARCH